MHGHEIVLCICVWCMNCCSQTYWTYTSESMLDLRQFVFGGLTKVYYILTKDLTISNKQAMYTYVCTYAHWTEVGRTLARGSGPCLIGQVSYWNLIMNCSSKRDYSGLLDRSYTAFRDGLANQTKTGYKSELRWRWMFKVVSDYICMCLQASSTMDSVCALSLHHQDRPGCMWPAFHFLKEAVRYT